MKHILTPVLLALLTATALTSLVTPSQVNAIPGPVGGYLDPSNVWAPYGPMTSKLQFNFYTDENVEFTQFELGQLDLTDWAVPRAKWASYDGNPDIVLSQAQGENGMFQIDFNHESSDWTNWGCDFQNGNNLCGAEIRKALAHLIDRPQWVLVSILGGAAEPLADPSPTVKTPSKSSLATQQSWDGTHATIDAFNIAVDPTGFAAPSSPDFCAAADHMIAAGVAAGKDPTTCVLTGANAGVFYSPLRFVIRSDSAPRRQMAIGLMTAINQLFGADVVAETLGDVSYLGDIVFTTDVIDDWSMYTGGWTLGGPFADHLGPLYGSKTATNLCGGGKTNRPLNYDFICVPEFDAFVDAAAQTDDMPTFITETLAAFNEFGKRALTIPVYSGGSRYAVLRDVAGRVDQKGVGYSNPWTLLNGRDDSLYAPSNPVYTFGGSSGSDTLRWGQRQGTTSLNIFHAFTQWDFNVLDRIYDSLVVTSPIEPEKVLAWMVNRYAITIDGAGDTHIVFDLRANLRWHDGQPLTAEDVKFSILSFRDAPAASLLGLVEKVKDVVIHGPLKMEIIYQGRSLFHILDTGVPIIPKHLWDTNNDDIVDTEKLDPNFDPLAAGILIGSGPFICRSIFPADVGRIGTGCASNPDGSRAGQRIPPGGKLVLEEFNLASPSNPYNQYMRSFDTSWPAAASGQFQEWSWADKDNNGIVDLVDLSSVAACFGKTAPDSACPATTFAYWDRLGTPGNITEEAIRVAARIDEAYIYPYNLPNSPVLVNIVPFTP